MKRFSALKSPAEDVDPFIKGLKKERFHFFKSPAEDVDPFIKGLKILIFLCFVTFPALAQTGLTITDALAPYKLSPTLLSNGHFSISTNYTTPTKGIIYREDGTSGKPVNYTSFFHVKVDNIVFQQSYESDTSDFTLPAKNPIKVEMTFRDTLAGTPRINARSYGVLPDGDTMRFLFTMFPVKRASGGFIRMTVTVQNTTRKPHKVGVLLLIDTKIGNNDQAPIATTFGYSTVEAQFDVGVGQGIPDFWLGLEGTPTSPGLVARGNLRDVGLVTPDRLLFGNWTDYTSQGIRGLGSVMWKERSASTNQYTDSGVLLIWDEEDFAVGKTKLKASTEIGIVDSLSVSLGGGSGGGGGGGGGGGFGLAGIGTCLSVETQLENPCGAPGYTPYLPDTLQALYLVSNLDTVQAAGNVRLVIENLPLGLLAPAMTSNVIPNTLSALQTGVSTLTIVPIPRLVSTNYRVPIAVVKDAANTVVLRDTLDVCVPGLLGALDGKDKTYPPVCPQTDDTLDVTFKLNGQRCLPTVSAMLTGNPVDVAQFSIIQPIPTLAKADTFITIKVRYAPTVNNANPVVGVVLTLNDSETLTPGNTTNVAVFDTAFVTVSSRAAEFEFARRIDTLNFGRICVGDTATGDWDILNLGGCSVVIQNGFTAVLQGANVFSITPATVFPDAIIRNGSKTVNLIFTPTSPGIYKALAIIQSPSIPFLDTLILIGQADVPLIAPLAALVDFDTLCVDQSIGKSIELKNPTACPIVIDSIRWTNAPQGWTVQPSAGLTIAPNASVFLRITGTFTSVGKYTSDVQVFSQNGVLQTAASAEVVTRTVQVTDSLFYGDVHVDSTVRDSITLRATGTADVVVNSILLSGLFPSEYSFTLRGGATLPHRIIPNDSLVVYVDFKPKDIEGRSASVVLGFNTACTVAGPLRLLGRGVQPLVDIRSRALALGRICAGTVLDTNIIIRNPGNAPLDITGITATGGSNFTLAQRQVLIPPDSAFKLNVRYESNTLGDENAVLTFTSNGRWITPADTTITLFATGIVCGTISADTVDAEVGKPLALAVRFAPDKATTKTPQQLVQMMNQSTLSAMSIGISYNGSLVRLRNFEANSGMIGRQLPQVVQVTPSTARITTTTALDESTIVATLRGDVLLNQDYQTPVRIQVDSFASGYSRIVTRDGLIRAQYCAFSNRQINTSGITTYLQIRQAPYNEVQVYTSEKATATLTLVNILGQTIATIYNGELASGTHSYALPEDLQHGMYFVMLKSAGGVLSEMWRF
ncbi:MAG: choice-of-anchor D domain-containing protein [Candidatus Kapaibacterium sp.]